KARVFAKVRDARHLGFAGPRTRGMLMPCATSVSAITRAWASAATIGPPCGTTFELRARASQNPCSTWVSATDVVMGSDAMVARQHIGSVVQPALVTGARSQPCDSLQCAQSEERAPRPRLG